MKPISNTIRRSLPTLGTWASALVFLLAMAVMAMAQGPTPPSQPTFSQAPPANTVIGNVATASYLDGANNPQIATSNTVTTIVQQVAGIHLISNHTRNAAPGVQVVFPHTLTNTGNGQDTYTLAITEAIANGFPTGSYKIYRDTDGTGVPNLNQEITNPNIPLAAGESFNFVIVVTVPGSAVSNDGTTLTVTATSTTTPAITAFNTDVLTVLANATTVNVTKSMTPTTTSAGTATEVEVTLTYTATGAGLAETVVIEDELPTGMTLVSDSTVWSIYTGGTIADNANLTNVPDGVRTNTLLVENTTAKFKATVGSIAPGETRTVKFKALVSASLASGTKLFNTAQYTYKPSTTAPPTSPTNTNTVEVNVDGTKSVTITPPTPPTTPPQVPLGGSHSFNNVVTNTGTTTDSYNIKLESSNYPDGTRFEFFHPDGSTPLLSTDTDEFPDTPPIAPGGTFTVVLKITLPNTLPSGYTIPTGGLVVSKVATSNSDPTIKSPPAVDGPIEIVRPSVDQTNTAAASQTGAVGVGPDDGVYKLSENTLPGGKATFVLFAENTGSRYDNYDISVVSSTLPAGWSVAFHQGATGTGTTPIVNTGNLNPGQSVGYRAVVSVPAGTPPGTHDITYRITSPITGATDTIVDRVVVAEVSTIVLTPNNTGQGYPGGTVSYSHTLTNTGNQEQTVTFDKNESLGGGWDTILYKVPAGATEYLPGQPGHELITITAGSKTQIVLPAGQSTGIIAVVSIPPGAAEGLSNGTQITATSVQGGTASATDTTTVFVSDLEIRKLQSVGNRNGPFSTSSAQADPGQEITYRLVVTNTGNGTATNVKLHDTVPAFTTLVTGSITKNPGTIAENYNTSTRALEFTVGTLGAGQTATVEFTVIIDAH